MKNVFILIKKLKNFMKNILKNFDLLFFKKKKKICNKKY